MAAPLQALQPVNPPAGPSPRTPEQRYWRSFRSPKLVSSPGSNPITHISYPTPLDTHSNLSSTAAPNDLFAVTSGYTVQLYSIQSLRLQKTITRFSLSDIAHSGEIRPDSRVVAAAGDSGTLQVFDTSSRVILKTWREHKQPVWSVKWSPTNLTHLLSCGDDRSVRIWDLTENDSTTQFRGHDDYVRAGAWLPKHDGNLLASGSYDTTVKLWDRRAPARAAMTFKHSEPVESVLPLPGGTSVAASAGGRISVLDLVAARPLHVLPAHSKTVTSLCLAAAGSRVVSAGLDAFVRVFDSSSWALVASAKYDSPVLALSVVPSPAGDDRHLAAGLQSGVLSLKTRLPGAEKAARREKAKELDALADGRIDEYDAQAARKRRLAGLPQGTRKRLRGWDLDPGAELVVDGAERDGPRRKLPPWQRALHAAEYARALDIVLQPTVPRSKAKADALAKAEAKVKADALAKGKVKADALSESQGAKSKNREDAAEGPVDNTAVITLLTALHHRDALDAALRGRDEATLAPVLRWITAHLGEAAHVHLLVRIATRILDLYAPELAAEGHEATQSLMTRAELNWRERKGSKYREQPLLDTLVMRLHRRVRELVDDSQSAMSARGMIELVMAGVE